MIPFYFDTETLPIRPGLMAPRLVCIQSALGDEDPVILLANEGVKRLHTSLSDPNQLIIAHNLPFDAAVTCAYDESLIQPWFRALGSYRCRDTQTGEALKAIRDGNLGLRSKRKGEFALGTLTERYCGLILDKTEQSYRLRYALLEHTPVDQWPAPARKYALEDVTGLRALYKHQIGKHGYVSPDWEFQTAAAFALHLCAVWGVMIDQDSLAWAQVALLSRKDEAERLLEKTGIFVDGKISEISLKKAVVEACERLGRPVARTEPTEKMKAKGIKEGNVRTNAETLEELVKEVEINEPPNAEEKHPLLTYIAREQADYNLSHYFAPMTAAGNLPMNSRPNVLVNSGRTSWGGGKLDIYSPWWPEGIEGEEVKVGSNLQNFPKEAGVRDCIVARPDTVLSSTDWAALELRTLAQCVLWVVGYSTLADGFRKDPDWDPHTYFASHLTKRTYEEGMRLHKLKDPEFESIRLIAKNLNFALPGGVGAKKFQWMAKQSDPPIILSLDECYYYKQEWLNAYPEMVQYFAYFSWVSSNNKGFTQFVSKRFRGDLGYTDGCNTPFQGIGGDIAKFAMFDVSMKCYAMPKSVLYRSRPLVLVHDEIVAEHPIEVAHEGCLEIKASMNEAFQRFCPDVPSRAEETLMTRWIKNAKPRYLNGRLIPHDA